MNCILNLWIISEKVEGKNIYSDFGGRLILALINVNFIFIPKLESASFFPVSVNQKFGPVQWECLF